MYAPSETNPHLGVPRPSSVQSHGSAAQNPCPTSGLPAKHIKLLKRQALDHPSWIEIVQVDQKLANPTQWRGVQYVSFSLRASRSFPTSPELERAHYSLLTSSNTRNPTLAMVITPRSMKSVRRPCVFSPRSWCRIMGVSGCSPIFSPNQTSCRSFLTKVEGQL